MSNFKSYSQYGEDEILRTILNKNGYFLEIGAFDPFVFSNTRFLVELGWSGCYVDGCSYSISKFINEYKHNNNIEIIQALVGTEDKLTEFHSSFGDAISTNNLNHLNLWTNSGAYFKKIYTSIITVKTMETVLPPVVDFINIDVEGSSAELATLIDYDKFNTKVVCIEHDNKIELLSSHLGKYNFVLHFLNGTNAIYKRN